MGKKIVRCGCGKHHVRPGDHTVTWRGELWDAGCAFHEIQQNNAELLRDARSSYNRYRVLRRIVAWNKCALCNQQLGKRFKVFGDNVYHAHCLYDIGGEG